MLPHAKKTRLDIAQVSVESGENLRTRELGDFGDVYLDTVDRRRLDFDFTPICSVSLANSHIYACLVCGKYFQGRRSNTPAWFHALHENHHVFIQMERLKVCRF